jgi:ABC-type amino acid transport substrate-binding protein
MKIVKYSRAATAAVAAGALTLAVAACGGSDGGGKANPYGLIHPGTITAATTADDQPFVTLDNTGKPTGMLVDLNSLIAQALGAKVVYKTTDLNSAFAGLTAHQYDLISVGLVATPERKKNVAFTKAIFWGQNVVIVRADSPAKSAADLTGKRVGASQNSNQADYTKQHLPKSTLVSEPSDTAAVSQLLNGNLDSAVMGSTQASIVMPQHPGKLKIIISAPQDNPGALAINKTETKFVAAYDEQLTKLVDQGVLLKLYNKYFAQIHLPYPSKMFTIWPQIQQQLKTQAPATPTPS